MKLLVNAPSGEQELIEVGEGGGYFDAGRVLWDERTDGPMPAVTPGAMVREGRDLRVDEDRLAALAGRKMDAAKEALLRGVKRLADGLRDAMMAGAHPMEVQGWIAKAAEADAFAADPGDDAKFPIISLEARTRGVTAQELAAKITAKRSVLINAEAAIAGVSGRHRDAIRAITAMDEIEAYDITAHWPD